MHKSDVLSESVPGLTLCVCILGDILYRVCTEQSQVIVATYSVQVAPVKTIRVSDLCLQHTPQTGLLSLRLLKLKISCLYFQKFYRWVQTWD